MTYVYQGSGRQVTDPDSVTQHVTLEGESHTTQDTVEESDSGGPFGNVSTRDFTDAYEYTLDYDRPQPPEGWPEEEEWSSEDDGLTFTVLDYERVYHTHELRTDGSPEGLASPFSFLSSEGDLVQTESLIGNNEFSVTVVMTSTTVPFPWTGEPTSTGTGTLSGTAEFPNPGFPSNSFAMTHTGQDTFAWFSYGVIPDDAAGTPDLASTFSSTLTSPVAAVVYSQEPKVRQFADQPNTPVEDNVPGGPVQPELPEEGSDSDCCCGDDTGSDGDYFDQRKEGGDPEEQGDWVGDIYGDVVDRRGQQRDLADVEDYDSQNPDATPSDWDTFFNEWTIKLDTNNDGHNDIVMSNRLIPYRDFRNGQVNLNVQGLAKDKIKEYLDFINLAADIQEEKARIAMSSYGFLDSVGLGALTSTAGVARAEALGIQQMKWNDLSSDFDDKFGDVLARGRAEFSPDGSGTKVTEGYGLGSALSAFGITQKHSGGGLENDYPEGIVFGAIGAALIAKAGLRYLGGVAAKSLKGASGSLNNVAKTAASALDDAAKAAAESQCYALRPVGKYLESVDDVLANPNLLKGKAPSLVEHIIGKTPGWRIETLGRGSRQGQGWVFREYNSLGNPTGRMLRWHPGGGHHGPLPYWRVIDFQSKSPIIPGM